MLKRGLAVSLQRRDGRPCDNGDQVLSVVDEGLVKQPEYGRQLLQ